MSNTRLARAGASFLAPVKDWQDVRGSVEVERAFPKGSSDAEERGRRGVT